MIKTQLLIKWELIMLKLIDNNNGGLMEMEEDLKNGITSKNLEDSVNQMLTSIIKQDIH